jgi:hypothetical protein
MRAMTSCRLVGRSFAPSLERKAQPENVRPERALFYAPAGDALDRLGRIDDVDALMAAQGQQMLAISRDDQISACGDRGGNDLTQETAWAARRSYEAADQTAIRLLDVQPGGEENELRIQHHFLLQRKLERQHADLLALSRGDFWEVKARSSVEELMTDEESNRLGLMWA